jgi:streptogramin lyase
MGPGGYLYAARIVAAIYRIPPGGGTAAPWVIGGLGTVFDFDFDSQGNLWGCGNAAVISRVKPDLSVKTFPFVANSRTARVYNGYLYVGALLDTVEAIWRFSIVSADSLGPAEKYFDMSAYGVPGTGANAITFSSDNYMYVGINGPDGIIQVHPDRTWERYYQGLFQPTVGYFAWGKGSDLYSCNQNSGATSLKKINTQKSSAPYYGRQ